MKGKSVAPFFAVGDRVKAVDGAPRYMIAERKNIGRVGTVSRVIIDAAGIYYEVVFDDDGTDNIELVGLQPVQY